VAYRRANSDEIAFSIPNVGHHPSCWSGIAESTDNELAVKVLKDIADEERVHAGEFLRLLRELAPDEEKFCAKGPKR